MRINRYSALREIALLTKSAQSIIYGGGPVPAPVFTRRSKRAGLSQRDLKILEGPKYEPSEIEKSFHENFILPTKKEFGGTPGVDYDAEVYENPYTYKGVIRRIFDEKQWAELFGQPRAAGLHITGTPLGDQINLRKDSGLDTQAVNIHETNHEFQARNPNRANGGVSDNDKKKLDAAYRFTKQDLSPFYTDPTEELVSQEEHSTNGEFQFEIYKNLSRQLGRPASLEETRSYIENMTPEQVFSLFNGDKRNGYVEHNRDMKHLGHDATDDVPLDLPKQILVKRPEDIRNAPWFKRNPEYFEPFLQRGSLLFPRALWKSREKGKRKFDDEDLKRIEAFRRAWLEVAKAGHKDNDVMAKSAQFIPFVGSGWMASQGDGSQGAARKPSAHKPVPGRVFYVNAPDHNIQVVGRKGLKVLNGLVNGNWDGRLPLGHAGVLTVDQGGNAKYFDYGRYKKGEGKTIGEIREAYRGNVRSQPVANWSKDMSGEDYARLLADVLDENRLELYGTDSDDIGAVHRFFDNMAGNRADYSVLRNNCGTVARDAFDIGAGRSASPGVVLPTTGWHGFTPSQNAPADAKIRYSFKKEGSVNKLSLLRKIAQAEQQDKADDLEGLLPEGAYPWENATYSTETQIVPDVALKFIQNPFWTSPGLGSVYRAGAPLLDLPIDKKGREYLENPIKSGLIKDILQGAKDAGSWQEYANRITDKASLFGANVIPDKGWIPTTNALDYATRPFFANGMEINDDSIAEAGQRFAKGLRHNTRPSKQVAQHE